MNGDTQNKVLCNTQGSNVKHFTTHQSFCVRACLTLIYFYFFTFLCVDKKVRKTKTNLSI